MLAVACDQLGIVTEELGVMVVDHGSRRTESNAALLQVVQVFRDATGYPLIRARPYGTCRTHDCPSLRRTGRRRGQVYRRPPVLFAAWTTLVPGHSRSGGSGSGRLSGGGFYRQLTPGHSPVDGSDHERSDPRLPPSSSGTRTIVRLVR